MASYNGPPPGGNDPNNHLQAMFARMQAARHAQEEDSNSTAHDLLSRFSAYNQGNHQGNTQGNHHQSNNSQQPPFYDLSSTDSPVLGTSDNFPLPSAPSPRATSLIPITLRA